MATYYEEAGQVLVSQRADLPFQRLDAAQVAARPPRHAVWLFERPADRCRAGFLVDQPGQLAQRREGVFWLDTRQLSGGEAVDPVLAALIGQGALRAVNYAHPRWRELALREIPPPQAKRLHLLALGDVGSTLLMGLRLLGGDVLAAIGICDLDEKQAQRWEFEINQIAYPGDYGKLPKVEVIAPEQLFDCDVFVFCASRGLPPVGAPVQDVRMAQFASNAAIVKQYAQQARAARFAGLFAVVSDPVDPLCKTAFLESNRDAAGVFDGQGLLAEQIRGYGLGVMNARAAYYAQRDARFAAFLTEGRAYGPHGQDLVIANSLAAYDDALSRELTQLAVTANLKMRELGFKPYVAPALSSAALSLLLTLRGNWHYSSVFLGGVYMGCKNRGLAPVQQVAAEPLPPALFQRIQNAADHLAALI